MVFQNRVHYGDDKVNFFNSVGKHMTTKLTQKLIIAAGACSLLLCSLHSVNGQDLLGYWKLDETDFDSLAIDSSGNDLNGIFEGDVDPDIEGAPGFGSGALFDGTTSQILVDGGLDAFGTLTNDFTVMAWISPEQLDRKGRIFGSFPVGGGWGFGTVGNELEITTYGVKDYDQPADLELDVWTHVAVALDADNNAHFYKDGEFLGTQTHGAPGNPIENEFFIGASCCAAEFFEGIIDEVGVFQGTLSETQISNAMMNGVDQFDAGGDECNPDSLGDLDGNGEVAFADFLTLSANFGSAAADHTTGDIDCDGTVAFADFLIMSANFGATVAGAESVPEPSTFALLGLSMFCLGMFRRQRN